MVFPGFAVEVVLAQLEHGAPMASVEPVKALDVTGEPVESIEGIVCASTGLRVAARARASRPYLISPSLRKAVP